jgi:hypothetical protein
LKTNKCTEIKIIFENCTMTEVNVGQLSEENGYLSGSYYIH